MTGSVVYPYGSTSRMRADTLTVLGVLKVVTASQVQRIARPGARDNKVVRNALLDLARHGLVVSDGNTQGPPGAFGRARTTATTVPPHAAGEHPKAQKIWRLTPAGLDAAAQLLPADHRLGGVARGAGRHGAPHAMAVNETIIAFLQHATNTDGAPHGLGTIAAWSTEVVLPVTGSVSAPSKGSPRPDAVLRSPESDPPLPLLCVEVDTGTESPPVIAEKLERYRRFFRRTVTVPSNSFGTTRQTPYWRTLYGTTPKEGHPPVALVFTGVGPRGLANRMTAVEDLTRDHWAGQPRRERYYDVPDEGHWTEYDDAIPILATTLPELAQHGPHGPIWRRFGHPAAREDLAAAQANPDGEQARARWEDAVRQRRQEAEERRRLEQEEEERRRRDEEAAEAARVAAAAEEAARREACRRCGRPRHDDHWGTTYARTPVPDGIHCAECRTDLARPRTPFGRLTRRLSGY